MRLTWLVLFFGVALHSEGANLKTTESDFSVRDFSFKDGSKLPSLKIHYRTLGTLQKDKDGKATNAILVLHGTTGSGANFLGDNFAGVLFGPGQLLDANRYYIILPDGIGHGGSSKPSDGLRARFPHYDYDDMVEAQYRLLTQGLEVNHLRLVMGTSMGGMHTWVWAESHPDFMDALLPLACLPAKIVGRNRMLRRMIIDAIQRDPDWKKGDYKKEPVRGIASGLSLLFFMSSAPLYDQEKYPTREAADQYIEAWMKSAVAKTDANDLLYQLYSSRNYDPGPQLQTIKAPLTAINSADDQINPPELGIAEREIKKVPKGKFILIPISSETRGHGTHSLPMLWKQHLEDLLNHS